MGDSAVAQRFAEAFAASYSRRYLPAIGHADLFLTENCNHACDYCFVEGKRRDKRLSADTARQALVFLRDWSGPYNTISVLLFGGEPLLEMPLIGAIMDMAGEITRGTPKKFAFDMTTNGTLVDEEVARRCAGWGIKLLFSIDGDAETHDRHRRMTSGRSSYEAVVSRIAPLKRWQPWLGTRMTVHPDCVERLSANVRHLFSLGINQFLIGAVTGIQWTQEQVDTYEDQLCEVFTWYKDMLARKAPLRIGLFEKSIEGPSSQWKDSWGCGAGRARIAITTDGGLYGCGKLVGIDEMKETWKMGDVWRGITNLNARWPLMDMTCNRRPKCRVCEYGDECTGGCPAVNYKVTGSVLDPDPTECKIVRAIMRVKERVGTF